MDRAGPAGKLAIGSKFILDLMKLVVFLMLSLSTLLCSVTHGSA
jgi:hypothetical protein